MVDNKTDFFIQTALLDKYIHRDPSEDPIAVKVITQRLKESNDLLKYFFSQSPSPEWAETLLKNGLFENPTQVEIGENGFRTPRWPQSMYLKEIAKYKPEVVLDIISNISTNNPTIHADLVGALEQIPADMSIKLLEVVKKWLENEFLTPLTVLPEALSHLVVHYVENNQKSVGFDLLDELIRPIPTHPSQQNNYGLGGVVRPRFDLKYLRPDFWKETLPHLERYAHEEVIGCLLKNFILAVRLEISDDTTKPDFSWITSNWRSSIGDTSQDLDTPYKSTLLKALRDSLSRYVKKDSNLGKETIKLMMVHDFKMLARIGIYVTAINANVLSDLAYQTLKNKNFLYNIEFHNEYFELLKQGYPILSSDEKKEIIGLIKAGPLPETTEKLAIALASQYGETIDEYKRKFTGVWIRDRLWMIKQYLEADELLVLNNLVKNYGEPQHPEFLAYISEVQSIREESPLTVDEIFAYTPKELIDFIKKWKPDNRLQIAPIEISHRGFAQAIASAFYQKPQSYKEVLKDFAELPSPYISTIFSFAQSRLKDGRSIPWEEMISLIEIVAEISKNTMSNEDNKKNINKRLSAVWFINDALQGTNHIPLDYLDAIENALIVFVYDTDPDEQKENPPEGYVGYKDPITLSINSVRPLALDSLFHLIILERRILSREPIQGKESRFNILKPVLEDKLDKSKEPSWAVHSIFGKWVSYLYFIDSEWVSNHIPYIFPETAELEKYFLAAWEYYITTEPVSELFSLIRPKYSKAIHNLSQGKQLASYINVETHLASHILLDYFWQQYNLTSPDEKNLLGLFFSVCDQESRGKLIWTLWKYVEAMDDEEKLKEWSKIREIWKWRTNEFVLSGYSNEFHSEFQWLSYILLEVPKIEGTISRLISFLDPMITFADDHLVWRNLERYLSNQVESEPEQAIKFYRLMHERVKTPEYGIFSYGEESDKIIFTAIKDSKSKKDTLALVNMIGRYNQRYREIYEENTK